MKHWSPSTFVLLFANLLILAFVFIFRLRFYDLIMIFWSETVIIGFFNLIKMVICVRSPEAPKELADLQTNCEHRTPKKHAQLISFFMLHFFTFCFGYSLALKKAFLPEINSEDGFIASFDLDLNFIVGVSILFISHALSFFLNFIRKREYFFTSIGSLIAAPYARLLLVQGFILLAGWLLTKSAEDTFILTAIFVTGKILIDIWRHNVEHQAMLELELALNKSSQKKSKPSKRKKRKR